MNWLDLLAVIPYYVGLMLTLYKNKVIVGLEKHLNFLN